MVRNFFKTASRNILKHKVYSVINFIGLTCGLAVALLIISYVRHELSYDKFHENIDRLYRLKYVAPNGLELATSPPPIAPVIKDYFPEVDEVARVFLRTVSIKKPASSETFEEQGVMFADSAITKMFTLSFVAGNATRALAEKYTVVLTEEMALKYFGSSNPIGEELLFSGKVPFKVIGVVKDFPENSHLRFSMLIPYDDMFELEDENTENVLRNNLARNFIISHSYTYFMLKPGVLPDSINKNFDSFLKKYADPRFLVGQVFTLLPVADIHLRSSLLAESEPTNSMTTIYIFIGVGLLTLIIASINYINLSTAQSFSRIKEIGIRKILGSMRHQLIGQFLSESFLFCFVALSLAYGVFYLTLPILNELTAKELVFSDLIDQTLIIASIILLVIITLLAGGYPAYFVTTFDSVNALKGAGTSGDGRHLLRKALVVFQLTIACLLLSGSLFIVKQLNYLKNRPLGFQKEHVINIPLYSQNINAYFRQGDSTFTTRLQSFRNTIEAQSGIKSTTLSSGSPGLGVVFRGAVPDGFTREDNLFVANLAVDFDFMDAFGLELVTGRTFSKDYGTDEREAFIINETAVTEFKWGTPQEALGKTIDREGKIGKVIGVIKDFNFTDLTTPVSALIMSIDRNQFSSLSVRFENGNVEHTIEAMEENWNLIFPEKAFEFSFLEEQLNNQYTAYQNFGNIIQSFSLVAIVIACLGVYGLVLFTIQNKVKEIGVRKVLGASVGSILKLIYRDFALLLVLGFILALPVSYYLMAKWFSNFIYHTSIDAGTYLISFSIVLLIVLATISYQAIRAAQVSPVKSLKQE